MNRFMVDTSVLVPAGSPDPASGWLDQSGEKKSVLFFPIKGDRPGHPFRGNQWTGGRGTSSNAGDITSRVRSDRALGGGLNESRTVEWEEGGVVKKGCFKPADGENAGPKMFRGRQTESEVCASIVDEELGLGLGSKCVRASIKGREGSLAEWINDDAKLASEMTDDELKTVGGLNDMLYYDALIGNSDRHLKNWLVKDGQARTIDNGRAFGRNVDYATSDMVFFRTLEHDRSLRGLVRPSEKFQKGLDKVLKDRERVDARLKDAGLDDARRDSFWKRAEYIAKQGKGFGMGFGDGLLRDMGRAAEGMAQPWDL